MRWLGLLFATVVAASPMAAQSSTGEFRLLGFAAYAPEVSRAAGFQDPAGPPESSSMAGAAGDFSFVAGRFRLGPEGFVLRGSDRRVWSFGGVARYEAGSSGFRPFGVLGAGLYSWDRPSSIDVPPTPAFRSWGSDVSLVSLSVGAGVSLGARGRRLAAIAEARVHRTLARPEFTGARSMVTFGLGGRFAW